MTTRTDEHRISRDRFIDLQTTSWLERTRVLLDGPSSKDSRWAARRGAWPVAHASLRAGQSAGIVDNAVRDRVRPPHRRDTHELHGFAARVAFTVNGSVPAPTLRWKEGDTVTLRVANTLDEDASIHWHGIFCPRIWTASPGLSFHGIRPGETYVYQLRRQAGRHVLVSQPLRVPGAARPVRAARHRAAESPSRSSTTANTS